MFPLRKLSYLLATWLAIFGSAVLKGGDGVKGFVQCGSNAYWTVVMLPATVAVPLTYSFGRELVLKSEQKKSIGYRAARGDIRWDKKCTTLYPAICFACGVAAGALGIAAGMILSPILLELGMIPAVAAATSGFAVLFTSSCTRFYRIFFVSACLIHKITLFLQPAVSCARTLIPILRHGVSFAQVSSSSAAVMTSFILSCCLTGVAGAYVGNTVISQYIQKHKKT